MNKSKFLKKSLAMLLALMLVVAMIPLSAAAAPAVLQILAYGDNDQQITLTADGEGNYTGSIPNAASELKLEVLAEPGAAVYYVDDINAAAADEIAFEADGDVDDKWVAENIDIHDFSEGGTGTVTVVIRVYDDANRKNPDQYTVTLTREAPSSETGIETLYLQTNAKPRVPQLGYTVVNGHDLEITMPYSPTDNYTVRTLNLANGAKAQYAQPNSDAFADLVVGGAEADLAANATEVANGGRIRIVAQNGTFLDTYTLKITVASGIKSFETKEGLDAVVFPSSDKIAVLLPFGYSTDPENVKVDVDDNQYIELTPEFELDYESATVNYSVDDPNNRYDYDMGINGLTSGTTVQVPVDDIFGREGYERQYTWYSVDKNSNEYTYTWNGYKASNPDNWAGFTSQIKGDSTNPGDVADGDYDDSHTANFTIKYVEGTTRSYDIYFFETRTNNEAVISELSIGSEDAVIDQDAKTIDITLPAGTDASKLDLTDDATKLAITASGNADILFPGLKAENDVEIVETDDDATHSTWEPFAVDANEADTLNATSEVILRVVSEDGNTTTNYKLNVTVSDNYETPAISSMYLMAPGSDEAIKPVSTDNNTFTFELPYSTTKTQDLANYKLFYTKTVGSKATYEQSIGQTVTMAKSGAKLKGNEAFLPTPGSASKGVAIQVTSTNPNIAELPSGKDEYFIVINRKAGLTDSDLTAFALTGSRNWDDVSAANTYNHKTIDAPTATANGKVTVEVPWTAWQLWANDDPQYFGSTFTADTGAKVFYYVGTNSNALTELKPVREDKDVEDITINDPNAFAQENVDGKDPAKQVTLVVLSEKAWVDAGFDPATDRQITGFDALVAGTNGNKLTGYSIYSLSAKNAKPGQEANLTGLKLEDGTGWSDDLTIEKVGDTNVISGSVPYSFTSGDKETVKITLNYTVSQGAHVLSWDNNADGTNYATLNDIKGDMLYDLIPNADVAFCNDDDDAYVVLERADDSAVKDNEVIVKVYKGNQEITDSQNELLVVNEDGTKSFKGFEFQLTYDEPSDEHVFKSFAFKGYENFKGVIDEKNHTITVTLPFGTEYTYLVPVYEASDRAVVTVDDPALSGKPLFSGKTDVNFTAPRKFTVTAENESASSTYSVVVKIGDRFLDVNTDDWFYDNVMGAVDNGFMAGEGNGIFNPKRPATRAEFACTLASALGFVKEEGVEYETPFIDVKSGDWYDGAVNFCYDKGIISGYEDTTFRPKQTITRQEAAAMLNNAFDLTASTDVSKFTDAGKIASWATAHVGAVANAELMNGDAAGTFRPTGTLTRAELASIMMNALNHGFID